MGYNEFMNTNYQDDLRLLKKAKRRIMSALVLVYAMIFLFFFAAYFILNQSFLPQSEFLDQTYITAVVISAVAWLIVLFVIDTGRPAAKPVYYTMTALQTLFACWLIWRVYSDPSAWLVWLIWAVLMLAESYFLFRYGHWMFTSYYGRIFFEKTLMVYEQAPESVQNATHDESINQTRVYTAASHQPSTSSGAYQQPDYAGGAGFPSEKYQSGSPKLSQAVFEEDSQTSPLRERIAAHPWIAGIFSMKHRPLTYPRAAIRLGAVVYAELILFPILTEVFGFLFRSANGKFTFATSIIFTMCVISAVIWTVPIFFLYLKQNGFKALMAVGLGCEIISSVFYFFVLSRYYLQPMEDHVYRLSVFLWFALFDAIRYLILIWAILPIMKLPRINQESGSYSETALFSNMSLADLKDSLPKPAELAALARQTARSAMDSARPVLKKIAGPEDENKKEQLPGEENLQKADDEIQTPSEPEKAAAAQENFESAAKTQSPSSNRKVFPSRKDRMQKRNADHPLETHRPYENTEDPVILLPGDDGFDDLK